MLSLEEILKLLGCDYRVQDFPKRRIIGNIGNGFYMLVYYKHNDLKIKLQFETDAEIPVDIRSVFPVLDKDIVSVVAYLISYSHEIWERCNHNEDTLYQIFFGPSWNYNSQKKQNVCKSFQYEINLHWAPIDRNATTLFQNPDGSIDDISYRRYNEFAKYIQSTLSSHGYYQVHDEKENPEEISDGAIFCVHAQRLIGSIGAVADCWILVKNFNDSHIDSSVKKIQEYRERYGGKYFWHIVSASLNGNTVSTNVYQIRRLLDIAIASDNESLNRYS